jgi:hypothetical protein
MTPEVKWLHPSSSFTTGAGLRVDLKTLGILDIPTNPLPVGHAFRGFPVCFRYDLPGCSPPFDGSDQVSPATGDFYFQASDELVTRLIAEYNYGRNWTISADGTFTHKNSS